MKIKRFVKSTPKSICWIEQRDLIDLSYLLTKGYPISSALIIVNSKYQPLLQEIEQGKQLEEFIQFKKKTPFYQSLHFFLSISPFEQAVQSAYEYERMKKNFQKQWFKETAYPTFIFFFACLLFALFENVLYPQLQVFIQVEKTFTFHEILYFILQFIFISCCLGIVVYIFISIFYSKKDFLLMKLYHQILSKIPLVKKIISFELASNMYVLMKRGYSTKEMFLCLKTLKSNRYLTYNLNEMIEQCEQGVDLPIIFEKRDQLDEKFRYFIKMGLYSQNLENALYDYCEYQQLEFTRFIKKASVAVSCISYTFIALLVVTIYQILLIPLEMLNQL